MSTKALARYLYAHVPGLARLRFGAMDVTASAFAKPEYAGAAHLRIDTGLIIDVGANRGQSISALRKWAPKSRIVAFEPDPNCAQRLSQRYRNDPSVTFFDRALGSKSSSITFFSPRYGRWNCDGMAATSLKMATDWLDDPGRMYKFDAGKLSVEEYSVRCDTLDSYEFAPSLIKIHAQGAELDILRGARHTLQACNPVLLCAFPSHEVTKLLSEQGYAPFTFINGAFRPGEAKRPMTFTWFLNVRQRDTLVRPV